MKIKIIGFKVGKSRPTANRTVKGNKLSWKDEASMARVGQVLLEVLLVSDFISIRRVDE